MTRPKLEIMAIATLVVVGVWAFSVGAAYGNVLLIAAGVGWLVAAAGVWRRAAWAYLLGGFCGVAQILLAGFILVFSLGLAIPEDIDLGDPWFGVGFAVLNGYATILLLGAVIVGSVAMLVVAWRGLRRRAGPAA
jgi:hypothetical protein